MSKPSNYGCSACLLTSHIVLTEASVCLRSATNALRYEASSTFLLSGKHLDPTYTDVGASSSLGYGGSCYIELQDSYKCLPQSAFDPIPSFHPNQLLLRASNPRLVGSTMAPQKGKAGKYLPSIDPFLIRTSCSYQPFLSCSLAGRG